jgi:hypothetical protein
VPSWQPARRFPPPVHPASSFRAVDAVFSPKNVGWGSYAGPYVWSSKEPRLYLVYGRFGEVAVAVAVAPARPPQPMGARDQGPLPGTSAGRPSRRRQTAASSACGHSQPTASPQPTGLQAHCWLLRLRPRPRPHPRPTPFTCLPPPAWGPRLNTPPLARVPALPECPVLPCPVLPTPDS